MNHQTPFTNVISFKFFVPGFDVPRIKVKQVYLRTLYLLPSFVKCYHCYKQRPTKDKRRNVKRHKCLKRYSSYNESIDFFSNIKIKFFSITEGIYQKTENWLFLFPGLSQRLGSQKQSLRLWTMQSHGWCRVGRPSFPRRSHLFHGLDSFRVGPLLKTKLMFGHLTVKNGKVRGKDIRNQSPRKIRTSGGPEKWNVWTFTKSP